MPGFASGIDVLHESDAFRLVAYCYWVMKIVPAASASHIYHGCAAGILVYFNKIRCMNQSVRFCRHAFLLLNRLDSRLTNEIHQ